MPQESLHECKTTCYDREGQSRGSSESRRHPRDQCGPAAGLASVTDPPPASGLARGRPLAAVPLRPPDITDIAPDITDIAPDITDIARRGSLITGPPTGCQKRPADQRPSRTAGRKRILFEPLQSPIEPLQSPIEPLQSPIEPLQSLIEPLQSLIEPLQSLIEPLQSLIEPLQSLIEPLQSPIEPLQSPIEPLQSLIEPLQSLIEPLK